MHKISVITKKLSARNKLLGLLGGLLRRLSRLFNPGLCILLCHTDSAGGLTQSPGNCRTQAWCPGGGSM